MKLLLLLGRAATIEADTAATGGALLVPAPGVASE